MAQFIEINSTRTYANEANAHKAVAAKHLPDSLRYFISWTKEGRCFPIFIGGEQAIQGGVHFHFNVVG